MSYYSYKAILYVGKRKIYCGTIDCCWNLGDDENIIFVRALNKNYRAVRWLEHGENARIKVERIE